MALRDNLNSVLEMMTKAYADDALAKFPVDKCPELARASRDLEAASISLLINAVDAYSNEEPEMANTALRIIQHVEELAVNCAKLYQRTKEADKVEEISVFFEDLFGGDSVGDDDPAASEYVSHSTRD